MKIGFAAHPDERKPVRRPARHLKSDETGQYAETEQYDGLLAAQLPNGTALPPAAFAALVAAPLTYHLYEVSIELMYCERFLFDGVGLLFQLR